MSEVTKIYDNLKFTRKSYKNGTINDYVVFDNGIDKGNDGKIGGMFATADPETQEWLENHPLYKKEFVLRKEVKSKDGKVNEGATRDLIVLEEIKTVSDAKIWIKEEADKHGIEVTSDDYKNGISIKEFIDKNGIKFPNLFED